jgi:ketosteroid isomerase-like protein
VHAGLSVEAATLESRRVWEEHFSTSTAPVRRSEDEVMLHLRTAIVAITVPFQRRSRLCWDAMVERDHAALITGFYEAFKRRDGAAMGIVYASDARFADPVFPDLRGSQVPAMWRMLTERGKDLEVSYRDVRVDGDHVTAHWEATYTFSATGRKVHNVIEATFDVRDGKVIRHVDRFDLWRWMGMALGASGTLLGWLPPVQGALRKKAREGLDLYMAGT